MADETKATAQPPKKRAPAGTRGKPVSLHPMSLGEALKLDRLSRRSRSRRPRDKAGSALNERKHRRKKISGKRLDYLFSNLFKA
jgi:hypothetical protein